MSERQTVFTLSVKGPYTGKPRPWPSAENGLQTASQIQAKKIVTVRRRDLDRRVGRLEDGYMRRLEEAVRDILGLRSD